MRIIGGQHKGRKIKRPKIGMVRPTKDRIREAVFNIIAAEISSRKVLDLFAGSGAYGLEALSRGAGETTFVEKDHRCVQIIRENIELLGAGEVTNIIETDVFKVFKTLSDRGEKFDLVFADPSYSRNMAKKTLIMINHYDILMPSGLLVMEHWVGEDVPEKEGDVSVLKQKSYE